jgi:membrane protease YdiL (CAAX protease family)
MSDISIPVQVTAPAIPAPAAAGTLVPRKPIAVPSILAWGALGLFAVMSVWIADQLPMLWGGQSHLPQLVLILPIGHLALLGVVMAALRSHGWSLRDYLALKPMRGRDVGRGMLWGFLGYILLSIIMVAAALILHGMGHPMTPPAAGHLQQNKLITLVAIWSTIAVAAPITEEFLFRGLLYRGLSESRLGVAGTLVITSVVFGLLHYPGFGWPRVIGTGLVGLLFGWLRWRNDNIGVSIVAHATLNFIAASLLTVGILLMP